MHFMNEGEVVRGGERRTGREIGQELIYLQYLAVSTVLSEFSSNVKLMSLRNSYI